jgi:predicted DNA-binding WGR domain protein
MVEPKLQILLQRRDCSFNAARFYVFAMEPSLYVDAVLVRAWGRIRSLGRQRLTPAAAAGNA